MDNHQGSDMGKEIIKDINKDFSLVGNSHIHGWYAWAIIGIVVGMFAGILYVSNRTAQFVSSQASQMNIMDADSDIKFLTYSEFEEILPTVNGVVVVSEGISEPSGFISTNQTSFDLPQDYPFLIEVTNFLNTSNQTYQVNIGSYIQPGVIQTYQVSSLGNLDGNYLLTTTEEKAKTCNCDKSVKANFKYYPDGFKSDGIPKNPSNVFAVGTLNTIEGEPPFYTDSNSFGVTFGPKSISENSQPCTSDAECKEYCDSIKFTWDDVLEALSKNESKFGSSKNAEAKITAAIAMGDKVESLSQKDVNVGSENGKCTEKKD